jgi:hypothetical protein
MLLQILRSDPAALFSEPFPHPHFCSRHRDWKSRNRSRNRQPLPDDYLRRGFRGAQLRKPGKILRPLKFKSPNS